MEGLPSCCPEFLSESFCCLPLEGLLSRLVEVDLTCCPDLWKVFLCPDLRLSCPDLFSLVYDLLLSRSVEFVLTCGVCLWMSRSVVYLWLFIAVQICVYLLSRSEFTYGLLSRSECSLVDVSLLSSF
jgi:hypothetical protein